MGADRCDYRDVVSSLMAGAALPAQHTELVGLADPPPPRPLATRSYSVIWRHAHRPAWAARGPWAAAGMPWSRGD